MIGSSLVYTYHYMWLLIASELKYLSGGGSDEARRHMETAEFKAMCERHHVDKDLRVRDALLALHVVALLV